MCTSGSRYSLEDNKLIKHIGLLEWEFTNIIILKICGRNRSQIV